MIWFNIKKIENLITEDKLTDKMGLHYLISSLIIGIFYNFLQQKFVDPSYNNFSFSAFEIIVSILVSLLLLPKIFKINTEIDDKDFFKRYIVITWVVRNQLLILSIIYAIFISVISESMNLQVSANDSVLFIIALVGLLMPVGFGILSFVLSVNSFNRIKKALVR